MTAMTEGTLIGDLEVLTDPDLAINTLQKKLNWIEAAGGVVRSSGCILFIHRLGRWDLPKGKLEKGETPEVGALREVEEECGISGLRIAQALQPTFHTYIVKDKVVLKKTHWFEMNVDGLPTLTAQYEEDISQAIWATEANLPRLLKDTYPAIRDVMAGFGVFD